MADDVFRTWAILELLGHRRLSGLVVEEERFGTKLIRIDVPDPDDTCKFVTQYYSAASLYCLTPTTEIVARAVAASNQPQPVNRWELPAPMKDDIPAEDPCSSDLPYGEDYGEDDYESDRIRAAEIIRSLYENEPCRICGDLIGDASDAVYAGYSAGDEARAAHCSCWNKHIPRAQWAYPDHVYQEGELPL